MTARLFVDATLQQGLDFSLPAGAARHVQVLRMQPGDGLVIFNGLGGEWLARITRMGRSDVQLVIESHDPVERELPIAVTLVAGIPANDRFDWLLEKATELGAATIVPTMCERSVLRLSGERAQKKREHWQGIAIAAAQQSGRTRVPAIAGVCSLNRYAVEPPAASAVEWLLSLDESAPLAQRLSECGKAPAAIHIFSGPEGGFTPAEELLLRARGALPTSLGARVLRSETAPLAALSYLSLHTSSR